MTHTASLPEETRGLDRRSVVKAAAWAAPVIAVAVAAPMAAASGEPEPITPGPNVWSGGVAIYENNWETPTRVEVNLDGETVGFTRRGAADGTIAIGAGAVQVKITWSAAGPVMPAIENLNNWIVVSGDPSTAAANGEIIFAYPGEILNGVANAVKLPSMVIGPVSGDSLPAGRVDTELTGTYLGAKRAGTDFGQ